MFINEEKALTVYVNEAQKKTLSKNDYISENLHEELFNVRKKKIFEKTNFQVTERAKQGKEQELVETVTKI